MKKLSLVIAFAFFGATASFAKSGISKSALKVKPTAAVKTSCTVKVTSGKYDVSITITCDCTRRQACDVAYKLASVTL